MLRLIFLTTVGFILFFAAARFGYLYLMSAEAGNSYAPLFILPTLLCVILSAASLLLAGRSKNMYSADSSQQFSPENDPSITSIGIKSALEKQNFIVSQWRKTNNMREKMKMVKISASSQQKPKF